MPPPVLASARLYAYPTSRLTRCSRISVCRTVSNSVNATSCRAATNGLRNIMRGGNPRNPATSCFSNRYRRVGGSELLFFMRNSTLRNPFFQSHGSRFFSANSSPDASVVLTALPVLSPPSVGRWLVGSAMLVLGVIVIGGVTRLTESGLSLTEWRPLTGILPPLSAAEWQEEFDKYKLTPEFKLLNHSIPLSDFKRIYYMEWTHRISGRVVGLAFVLPLAYFALRRRLASGLTARLAGMSLLLGFQGLLGWYMVQSGLEDSLMDTPGAVPRVSQYRLAAHLGTAVVLYAAMLGTGLAVLKDWSFAQKGTWSGANEVSWQKILSNPAVRAFKRNAWMLTALVFVTAMSGAFVAGLDAGLMYNEFPLMGGRLVPPPDELMNPIYAIQPDGSDTWWRNMLENPTTVQFDHRVLATTTYLSTAALYASTYTPTLRAALPAVTRRLAGAAFGVANVQVLLGIATLLYLVPVPLAAAHQAGSVLLLSHAIFLALSLRAPGTAARLWRHASATARIPK